MKNMFGGWAPKSSSGNTQTSWNKKKEEISAWGPPKECLEKEDKNIEGKKPKVETKKMEPKK